MSKPIKVAILSPTDLVGMIPGGIDTCIKGLVKWAPKDIEFCVYGATSRPDLAPILRPTRLNIGKKLVDFMPILRLDKPHRQARVPLILRYCARLFSSDAVPSGLIYQAHRMEPFLFGLRRKFQPRVMFQHTFMESIRDPATDIRWRSMPAAYFALERHAMASVSHAFAVHQGEAKRLKSINPDPSFKCEFLPSWVDPEIFYPADPVSDSNPSERQSLHELVRNHRFIVFCGRLEKGKRPLNLLAIFAEMKPKYPELKLVFIGDGSLSASVAARVRELGLGKDVLMLGVLEQPEVALYLRHAVALVLPSAYEGMPRAMLEALGSGIPVVSTDVGEVSEILCPGVNGYIVEPGNDSAFARAVTEVVSAPDKFSVDRCLASVERYHPYKRLAPVYAVYRQLSGSAVIT